MKTPRRAPRLLGAVLCAAVLLGSAHRSAWSGEHLQIHYINVGQGGATLIIGPDGTTILYDFGDVGRGKDIADFMRDVLHIRPEAGIDFAMVSHRDQDHYGGYVDVIDAGYDVRIANFGSGSNKSETRRMRETWLDPAARRTTAGAVSPIPVGLRIPLGNGAMAYVVAANGRIHGSTERLPYARHENDRSIVLYVKYREFDYILDGALGSGPEECTQHQTSQRNFQAPVARALIALGWMDPVHGVDLMHVANHGSESSTSAEYFDLVRPEVGVISVGQRQGKFRHPRADVVEKVLLQTDGDPAGCVRAPPLRALFQTEDGLPGASSTGETSVRGRVIGDISITTDGRREFRVRGSGRTANNRHDDVLRGQGWCFPLDSVPVEVVAQACDDS